ncbi:hypothetical protein [uncultured Tateyamaria sp.]|uniref:hypothetical protein n=1 Tax=Tateyamaria sp. TaxID=1929288 RepID=UPI002619660F|nr:hypothetical protein [uncultured Tateyamaria sp.]
MSIKGNAHDPKGLIFEAYRIEGITKSECRTILLDWALSLADGQDAVATIGHLLAEYEGAHPDHPMTHVLQEGQTRMSSPRRRGGWRSRTRAS